MSIVTAERFARGMTFEQYVAYTGTAENLAREAGWWLGTKRHDFSGLLRDRYEHAKLRIFPRDGQKLGRGPQADPADSPNADIVNAFLNVRDGQTFQTVPTVVFFTNALEVLYTYFEFPAIYHKRRLAQAMGVPTSRENREQDWERFIRDWGALQGSPFWQVWTSAAVDEMISALHERLVVGG